MTEWTVVTVIAALVTLFAGILTPVVKLITNLTSTKTKLEALEKAVAQGREHSGKSEQERDKQIQDLQLRLTMIERDRK